MSLHFIRDGKWCTCERSCNTAKGTLEDGLSVYSCRLDADRWIPEGQAWKKNSRSRSADPEALWFLVTGTPTGGLGGDGEPLIEGVTAENMLEWDGTGFTEKGPPGQCYSPHQQSATGECVCQNVLDVHKQMLEEDEDLLNDDPDDE